MDCEEFARLLDNYESLTLEEKIALCKHSTVCEKCRAELEFSRAVTDTVRTLPKIEAPSDFMQKLNKRIDAEERTTNKNKLIKHLYANRQKYSTVAACLLLVAVVGFNGKSLVDKMNGTDDGVIYETSSNRQPTGGEADTAPSSAPSAASSSSDGAGSSNVVSADNSSSEKRGSSATASPSGNESVSSDSGNTESASDSTAVSAGESGSASVSSRETASTGSGNGYGTSKSYSNSYGSGGESSRSYESYDTNTSGNTYSASEYTGITTAEPTAQTSESVIAETYAPSESESTATPESEGVSIPRERYVMSHDDGTENDEYADASGIETEDTSYSIADSDSDTTVAAADTEKALIPDQNSLVLDGLLLIREDDYDAACGMINDYISSAYGSCYMITPENLSNLCNAMQNAGIEFENSISAERSQIAFRVIKY